jgi:hypothetical protein
MIINKFYKLPEVNKDLAFCCDDGCGEIGVEIKVKYDKFERSVERCNKTSELLNAEYHYYPVCNKCGSDLFLLDYNGLDIKFDYIEDLKPNEEEYFRNTITIHRDKYF